MKHGEHVEGLQIEGGTDGGGEGERGSACGRFSADAPGGEGIG
jgi:hypothetical protein